MNPSKADGSTSTASMPPAFNAPPAGNELLDAVRANRIAMWLDTPSVSQSDGRTELPVRVEGWAYARTGIDNVTVVIDETPVRARYGQLRPDVAHVLAEPAAAGCGFTLLLDENVCGPGSHELTVVAVDRKQHAVGLTMTILAELPEQDDAPRTTLGTPPDSPDETLDPGRDRYVPELDQEAILAAEHHSRYAWATPLAGGRDILDAGCGVGWGTVELASAGARSAVGIDVSEVAVANARERAAGKAEFVRADLLSLPFEDSSFDLVVSFEAIEHVKEPERGLDELRRVLRPDGILAVSSPNRGVYPSGNPFHFHEFTSAELEASLRDRFRNVDMYRQQTHVGSILIDDRGHAIDDPTALIDARLHKLWAGEPGDELYTIALASDCALPPMQGVAVLTQTIELKAFYERIAMLEHRGRLAEAERSASRAQVAAMAVQHEQTLAQLLDTERARAAADEARALAERRLEGQRNSVPWRIWAMLGAAQRAALRARARRARR